MTNPDVNVETPCVNFTCASPILNRAMQEEFDPSFIVANKVVETDSSPIDDRSPMEMPPTSPTVEHRDSVEHYASVGGGAGGTSGHESGPMSPGRM